MSSVQHVSLWSESPALPMLETRPESRHTIIFIGGLSDSLATVPYLPLLADAVAHLNFSLVQPQLSSSLGGFGLSSLEADAREICLVIKHLQSRPIHPKPKDAKIIIMGHSTGCQDIAHLLSTDRPGVQVDGAILQAPVSDREYFEENNAEGSEERRMLNEATALKEQGRGATLLKRNIEPLPGSAEEYEVNGSVFQEPAMTAYRYWSLNAVGGDDDFFSSDLTEERVAQIWRDAIQRGSRVLALLGAVDEYYPTKVSPQKLAQKWTEIVASSRGPADRFEAIVLPDASHKVESDTAQAALVEKVIGLLNKVLQDEDAQVPSFDEVVELISSGKAESIPGFKTIPLKINDATPSASQMQRPAKPWESSTQANVEQPHVEQ